jgi:hypothetical protein
MAAEETPIAAVRRIANIANQLVAGPPNARELVAELFRLYAEVLRQENPTISPIETAPKAKHRKLLLYCPEQGGWQVGEWSEKRWLSTWRLEFLEPTHWTDVPSEPEKM